MKKVILTKGLPASGKSTWALEQIDKNPGMYKRVNKDDLRAMLDNSKWSKSNEKMILTVRDNIILSALEDGKHVIVDDTNLHLKHETHIRELVKGKAKVEIKDFTGISLNECIKRDSKRINSVGRKVIQNMYNSFLKPEPVIYERISNLPSAIICDIDGTIALMDGRSPFDWTEVGKDKINVPVYKVLHHFHNTGYAIMMLSGRDSVCRDETIKWLDDNNVPFDYLFMRKEGDNRKDTIVKKELFDEHIRNKYNVEFTLDDRNCVVEMWRNEIGLTVFQVAEGNF